MVSKRVQTIINALKQAGSDVSGGRGQWQAQCPVHKDDKASMSMTEDRSGKIMIYCHAGCKTRDILDQLDLDWDILFPERNKRGNKIIKTYPYTDEDGKLLFEVVRKQNKQFLQRQPATGGEWKWTSKGVRKVIYNLPDVLEAREEGRPIFICEGEKDADALIKRDLVATTSPMGAGKWRDEFNEFFDGAEVIILPDNDDPGREHAVAVTAGIIDHAKKVRILELPGLKEKQDVSDWLIGGGTRDELLELAFDTEPVSSESEAEAFLGIDTDIEEDEEPRSIKDLYFEEKLKIYANDENERVIADFNIDIKSIVKDDREGQIFYVKIRELDRGVERVSDTIEIKPEYLDDLRSFYKAIRPYSMGEILQYRSQKTKPLSIFKWLLQNFDKPIVRRPDHVGFTKANGRPFWLFGNALICPPWEDHEAKVVEPNEAGEYIVDETLGFTLPLYKNEMEKEQLAPFINCDTSGIDSFMGEAKEKIIRLIGGGDPDGRAPNYGKILLGYVIYHLYEQQLYYANDINGHTVMLYVHGPKGTGKTTYFNTLLRAFFGLHKTKEIKGNTVSIPSIENSMGMYSQMPVCYDEFNPEQSDITYQHINSYYHRTSRSVSDVDRQNRNKFTPIRSSLAITTNYPINLDVDQADATDSRTINFQYKKEYRSDDEDLFDWLKANLDNFSQITTYLLLSQTDKKRQEVKEKAEAYYRKMKTAVDREAREHPNKYNVEHRLTDNYTRILASYELVFGRDNGFRTFIYEELLSRFAAARANNKEVALLNQLAYLASSGRLKESWHYYYNDNKKELYVNLTQCYQLYEDFRRDQAIPMGQFRNILREYFDQCGGYATGTTRWYGSYYDRENNKVEVNKAQHSYILRYDQLDRNNMLKELFPPTDEDTQQHFKDNDEEDTSAIDFEKLEDPPF
ncbi:hypothetical protein [Halalkalibaculum sp. DA384]|uniref:hypothetical protein n=1 Tax=Halalkalibaculum sp. DA384 TaxID=3373606 RepID=UPI0037541891